MKKRMGTAIGNFRADSGMKWPDEKKLIEKKLKQPNAAKARERMISRENHQDGITDDIMRGLGGNTAAARQAAEYEKLMKDIKEGRVMADNAGSRAMAARQHMLERNLEKEEKRKRLQMELERLRKEAGLDPTTGRNLNGTKTPKVEQTEFGKALEMQAKLGTIERLERELEELR